MPGRTDNDIKNYWNTRLKKKLLGKHRKEQQQQQARNRGNNVVKQESNRGSGSDSLSFDLENSSTHEQQPYWPQMTMLPLQPLQYTNQNPSFNDQDSIKKLLIKLGGRFSDDNYHPNLDGFLNLHQFSDGTTTPSTQQVYIQEQVHMGSSSCISNCNINNNEVQYAQRVGVGLDLVQGQSSTFTSAIEEMVSTTNYPQRLDGLEFFYGEDNMVNDKIIGSSTTCSQSTNWGDVEISTQIYHPLVASNYHVQGLKLEMPQECALQEFSFPGPQ